eukprot:TRINITY_DN32742_c0_g1_i1.p1 TRINITY_DN32742_c0_g1~~TRINITY_DN32742_c0_g1_i1.p1  ORF type:complete len:371 (+),score=62.17 TRINITY_DN32742_c0_g1_i1:88-1200(+)
MDALSVGSVAGSLQTIGVSIAVATFLSSELRRRFGLTDVNLKWCCARILCRSWAETIGLLFVMCFALILRVFVHPDRGVNPYDQGEVQVWNRIKNEWPILMGADTLLSLQAMLRLLVFLVVMVRTSKSFCGFNPFKATEKAIARACDMAPLCGAAAILSLGAAGVRAALCSQTNAYILDGPLGGSVPIWVEMTSVPVLAAVNAKVAGSASAGMTAVAFGWAVWFSSRNYLNLSSRETGGDFQHDKLFILAHCLELVASMAFLASTIRKNVREKNTSIRTNRSYWDGFVYLVLPAQQALAAYYFLTAFEPSPGLVGQGRPFCLLTIGNLLQLMFYLTAMAFYLAECLLGANVSMPRAADVAAAPGEEIISV